MIPWTLTRFSVPLEEKYPHSIMLPPPCLTVGTQRSSAYIYFCFLPPDVFSIHMANSASIWPNNSQLCLIRPQDGWPKNGILLHVTSSKARRASIYFLAKLSSEACIHEDSPLCKTHSMVDRDTFVPAWSSVSIRALVVVQGLLLTSQAQQIFLASLGDTLCFLPCHWGF